MPQDLLKAKLFAPPLRPNAVERERLFSELESGLQPGVRLVLVCAPAGFGKTTLVTHWAEHARLKVYWLSLDAGDNQVRRFLRYLVAALQPARPGLGQQVMELLELPRRVSEEDLVASLANDLAGVEGPLLLALDDYHLIRDPAVHKLTALLLEYLPPNVHLILLSREEPPLPLARLRARSQLVELRSDNLRFTTPEANSFLDHTMGLRLTLPNVEALENRTEGWAAGLQMAALSLQGNTDPAEFIQNFSGSHRYILDYLLEEVLNRQPSWLQSFLLQTSLLERLSGPLCDSVFDPNERILPSQVHQGSTFPGKSQEVLEYLNRANLFLIPLDETRGWYRYHHLFADLLHARLKALRPDLPSRLYRRASQWCEGANSLKDAVSYALADGDHTRAADLQEEHHIEKWAFTDIEFMIQLHQVRPEVILERPALCLQRAWISIITGLTEDPMPLIEAAEKVLLQKEELSSVQRGMLAFARILRAYTGDFEGKGTDPELLQPALLEAVPLENLGMHNSVGVIIGSILYMEGRFQEAEGYFKDAVQRDKEAGGTNAIPVAGSRLARLWLVQGRLHDSAQFCRECMEYIEQRGTWRFYVAGSLNLVLADVLREWNNLEDAEAQVRLGIQLNEAWEVPQSICIGYALLSRIQMAKHDLEAARESLDKANSLLKNYRIHYEARNDVEATRIRLWLEEKDLPALETWAEQNHIRLEQDPAFRNENLRICLGRTWLALGETRRALALLDSVGDAAGEGKRTNRVVQVLAIKAAALAKAQPVEARRTLAEALRLAAAEKYVRTFLEVGTPLLELLCDPQLGSEAYVKSLLKAFTSEGFPLPPPAGTVRVQLSPRELEVLHLVAGGLSNQDIAEKLYLSIRTVKKHIENIHARLGVRSRTAAIARARELGLLS